MSAYVVVAEGLSRLDSMDDLDPRILQAARRAINATVRRTRTSSARQMRQEINFPARYLSGARGRLEISKMAQGRSLEAVITGRDRPTSLARFATSRNVSASRTKGVKVKVDANQTKTMKRAFLIKWANGELGLAMRLREGETLRNKKYIKQAGKGLYVLYGPSVDQVFAQITDEQGQESINFLEQEFLRLLNLE